jgi:hypothetical protein
MRLIKDMLEYIIRGNLLKTFNPREAKEKTSQPIIDVNFEKPGKILTYRYRRWISVLNLKNLPEIFRRFILSKIQRNSQINLSILKAFQNHHHLNQILDISESDSNKTAVKLAIELELNNMFFFIPEVYLIILRFLRKEIESSKFFHQDIDKILSSSSTNKKKFRNPITTVKKSSLINFFNKSDNNFLSFFNLSLIKMKCGVFRHKNKYKKLVILT